MRKSTVILILITFLYQNITWGREFTLRPPLQGSLAQRAGEVLNGKAEMPQSNTDTPAFLLTGKIKLTKRQKAVLDLTAKGWRQSHIAGELSIDKTTVKVHRKTIRDRLDLKGQGIRTRGAFLYHIYLKGYIITQPPKELVTKIIDFATRLSIARREVLESAMSGNGSIKDIAAHLNKPKGTVKKQISEINCSFENITNKNEFPGWKVDFWLAAAILSVNLEAYNEAKKAAERSKTAIRTLIEEQKAVLDLTAKAWRGSDIARELTLTDREKQVLDLKAKGWREGVIATALSIAEKTVNVHRDRIGDKLYLKDKGIGTRGAFLYYIYQKDYIITQPPKELVTKIIDLASKLRIARRKVLESAMSGNGLIKDIAAHLNKSKKTIDVHISDINRSFENITSENEFPEWEIDFWLAAAILSVNLEAYNKAKEAAERSKINERLTRGSL